MLSKYKEIFLGLAFGIGAFLIDWALDSAADGNSLVDEMTEHPGMLVYRAVFIVFGLFLGWLLWQNSRRERENRRMSELLQKVQQECSTQGLILRSSLQTILTRSDLHLTDEAARLLQDVYAKSEELQKIAEEK